MNSRAFPLYIALGVTVVSLLAAWALGEGRDEVAMLASRYTARVSFPIFIVAYLASSLARLWPGEASRAILSRRRQWGLGFAFAHTVHLVALGIYNIMVLNMPSMQALLGGGLAYGLMFAMALTSNAWGMRALGRHWKTLHRVGIHWLWFIFTFSYFGRLFDPERAAIGYVFFPICVAALGIRLWAWRRRMQPVMA
jgi:methionine sulfoxide reductase heme-binding subunit